MEERNWSKHHIIAMKEAFSKRSVFDIHTKMERGQFIYSGEL